jgi:hypothetical protein
VIPDRVAAISDAEFIPKPHDESRFWHLEGVTGAVSDCGGRLLQVAGDPTGRVSVALRILDDGAWLSVNDQRRVSVSELWRLHAPEFCSCDLVDFIAEGFTEVSADGRDVAVTTYGKCIACGESGVPGKLPVGYIQEGEYHNYDRENIVMEPIEDRRGTNRQ